MWKVSTFVTMQNYKFRKFSEKEKSTFPYWYYHWKAYNLVALKLKCWKFRFLFHDWYKPWMRLVLPYSKVSEYHKTHSRHHRQYKGKKPIDYLGMVIDWEASQYTKEASPYNAREYMEKFHPELRDKIEPILESLKL